MRDVVVIGDAEEIESGVRGPEQHLLGRPVAVGVDGVAVKVATQPARPRDGERIRIDATSRPGETRRLADLRVEPDLDLPIATSRADLVRTEKHVPAARADRPLAVGRSRPRLVDRELHLVAAAPPAESGAPLGDATFVEHSDIERVATADRRVGVDLIAVRVAHVDLPHTSRNVEGHVRVAALVYPLESPRKDEVWPAAGRQFSLRGAPRGRASRASARSRSRTRGAEGRRAPTRA